MNWINFCIVFRFYRIIFICFFGVKMVYRFDGMLNNYENWNYVSFMKVFKKNCVSLILVFECFNGG